MSLGKTETAQPSCPSFCRLSHTRPQRVGLLLLAGSNSCSRAHFFSIPALHLCSRSFPVPPDQILVKNERPPAHISYILASNSNPSPTGLTMNQHPHASTSNARMPWCTPPASPLYAVPTQLWTRIAHVTEPALARVSSARLDGPHTTSDDMLYIRRLHRRVPSKPLVITVRPTHIRRCRDTCLRINKSSRAPFSSPNVLHDILDQ